MEKVYDSPPKQNISQPLLVSPTPASKSPQSRLTPKIRKQHPPFSLDEADNVEITQDSSTKQTQETTGDDEDDDDDDSRKRQIDKGGPGFDAMNEAWFDNVDKKKSMDRLIDLFKSIEEEAKEEAQSLDDLEMEIASTSDEITAVNEDIKQLQTHVDELKAEIQKAERQLKVTAPSTLGRFYMSSTPTFTDGLLVLGIAGIVVCFALVALMRVQELRLTSQNEVHKAIGQTPY